jgi:hypothetical protein
VKSPLRFRLLTALIPAIGLLTLPATSAASAITHDLHPYQGLFNGTSANWSGYAAHGATDAFNSVSATWVQPAGQCTSGRAFSAFWVGLDGYTSTTVEQTGSSVDCTVGDLPKYYAWYEMYPADPVNFSNTVLAGDHFTASVTASGAIFTLTISDTTQGWQQSVTQTLAKAKKSSAEIIAEAPCCTNAGGILPLTDFGSMKFKQADANGAPIGNSSPGKIKMAPGDGANNSDTTSPLTNGDKFTVTWDGN